MTLASSGPTRERARAHRSAGIVGRGPPAVVGGRRERAGRRAHRVRDRRARGRRAHPLARPQLRGQRLRARGQLVDRHGRGREPAATGRLRRDAGRGAARAPQRLRRARAMGGDVGAAAAVARPGRHLRGPGAARARADTDRRARSADAFVRAHRSREHGGGQADAGHARGLGEHADGAARLQRHHREDDGRRRPRRAAPHDVHGAVRAARARRAPRPPVRGDVPDPRGRGRRGVRRRAVPPRARATSRGPASAASTRSRTPGPGSCAGSRPRRRNRPIATPTGSPGTGST